MSGSAVSLLLAIGGIAWLAFAPANPSRHRFRTLSRAAWQWLRVLGCRVVSLTRRCRVRRPDAPPAGRSGWLYGGIVAVSPGTSTRVQVHPRKRVHPLTPPAAPAPVRPRVRLDAWVRRELTDPHDRELRAHVIREAARLHRVSKRTAQRAVRRVAGGAR